MHLFWNENLRKKKGLPSRIQKTNWRFTYGGKKRYIPAIYRFPQGIVFDLITPLEEEEMRRFYHKYRAYSHGEDTLTEIERRVIESEHPYQPVPISHIHINGNKPVDGWTATDSIYIPWIKSASTLLMEKKAYAHVLQQVSCFACNRYTVPFTQEQEPSSRWERCLGWLFPEKINCLELHTQNAVRFYPLAIEFTLPQNFKGVHRETFRHPLSGDTHELYFQDIHSMKTAIPMGDNAKKLYLAQLYYEIDPPLPQGDELQFNATIQSQHLPETDKTGGFSFIPESAGAIGVIGGNDGPTAMFFGVGIQKENPPPTGLHGLPMQSLMAKPAFIKKDPLTVQIDGINIHHLNEQKFMFPT